jgi:hypothetical protein
LIDLWHIWLAGPGAQVLAALVPELEQLQVLKVLVELGLRAVCQTIQTNSAVHHLSILREQYGDDVDIDKFARLLFSPGALGGYGVSWEMNVLHVKGHHASEVHLHGGGLLGGPEAETCAACVRRSQARGSGGKQQPPRPAAEGVPAGAGKQRGRRAAGAGPADTKGPESSGRAGWGTSLARARG